MAIFKSPAKSSVSRLLAANDLPNADLEPLDFNHFFGFGCEDDLLGIIGLELFGDVALLRSLVVTNSTRGTGLGRLLVAHIERYAKTLGVSQLYLLTTTAEDFFFRLGYSRATRQEAPQAIQNTREFSSLCPDNAAFMVKTLK